jgi:K+-transporting ATPase KdpF subunit
MLDLAYVLAPAALSRPCWCTCAAARCWAATHRWPRRRPMSAESWTALMVAAAVLVYLTYTLLRPERF